jgi:hypothetical protein
MANEFSIRKATLADSQEVLECLKEAFEPYCVFWDGIIGTSKTVLRSLLVPGSGENLDAFE